MTHLRALIREHRHLAIALLVLALCIKAAIPAGMMVAGTQDKVLTVTICTGGTGDPVPLEIVVPTRPGKGGGDHSGDVAKSDHCAFASLTQTALGGADPILLAASVAFILVLGLAPVRAAPLARFRYLLPPLRGPPAAA